jgi:hypothetical protein
MNKIMHPIEPEELMAYLDGELSADRATATAAHLGECAECQGLVAELRSISQELTAWKLGTVESEMPHAISSVLEQHKFEPRKVTADTPRSGRYLMGLRWQTAAWMGALAAVFLVVVGTVKFIGGNANNVFSQVSEADFSIQRNETHPAPPPPPPASPMTASRSLHASATPGDQDKLEQFAKLNRAPAVKFGSATQEDDSAAARGIGATGPMIIRTAQLSVITKEFDRARAAIEATLKRHRGYVGELKVGGASGSGRTLTATLRVPADQLDATLAELKTLGRVESESQSGDDVTSQYVDLQARLANARNTSQRLTDLLQNRTGKLSDVLEVEQELDRVRGEIEQMEAERKNMTNQVSFATLNVTVSEDYKAQLQVVPPSTWTRLSNAAVDGYRSVVEGVLSVALFLLTTGPSLLLWGAIFFFPARLIWKKVRRGVVS